MVLHQWHSVSIRVLPPVLLDKLVQKFVDIPAETSKAPAPNAREQSWRDLCLRAWNPLSSTQWLCPDHSLPMMNPSNNFFPSMSVSVCSCTFWRWACETFLSAASQCASWSSWNISLKSIATQVEDLKAIWGWNMLKWDILMYLQHSPAALSHNKKHPRPLQQLVSRHTQIFGTFLLHDGFHLSSTHLPLSPSNGSVTLR